jgi:hypothetical protein
MPEEMFPVAPVIRMVFAMIGFSLGESQLS